MGTLNDIATPWLPGIHALLFALMEDRAVCGLPSGNPLAVLLLGGPVYLVHVMAIQCSRNNWSCAHFLCT